MWTVSSLCHVSTGGRGGVGWGANINTKTKKKKNGSLCHVSTMSIFEKEKETNYTTTRILVFDTRHNM